MRLLFLLSMLLGLAVTPVQSVGGCVAAVRAESCGGCCERSEATCCEVSDAMPSPASATTAPTSSDPKQLVAPVLIFVGPAPLPGVEGRPVQRAHAARKPAQPVIAKTCIRLI